MKWTVEVDAAGLPMTGVVLKDTLPQGLTYVEGSFAADPSIPGAAAAAVGQELTITLGEVKQKTTVTFDTQVNPEKLGFGGGDAVSVENTIRMTGSADSAPFAEVSHRVQQNFSNHGLVKSSTVHEREQFIQYEVLINPYQLALPDTPSLVDTLDQRLQLDTDTLTFYGASLHGTTAAGGQKPGYEKTGEGRPLKLSSFDPDTNSFTVPLPISGGSKDAYVLTYRADIIDYQAGSYSNSVRFDGGGLLLGGNKDNSASVGGGGGGGVAARKASIAVVKTDGETNDPRPGVSFRLYQWDSGEQERGLPFAQGITDAKGELSFKVTPGASYELVELESAPGYGSKFGWTGELPEGAAETDGGLLLQAGAAKSVLTLELTNDAHTTDLVFRLVNESLIPMTGEKVLLFTSDPAGQPDPVPTGEAAVSFDGTVKFSGVRRGARYYIRRPGGGMMTIDVPAQVNEEPTVTLPDGTSAVLTADYAVTGVTAPDRQWELTVRKVCSGGTAPLAGASIGLYADAACQALIKSGVSAQDGTVLFSGLLKGQRYWLKETAAPPHYELDTAVYEANEADPSVTIANTPKVPPVTPDEPDAPVTPDEPGASSRPGTPGRPNSPDEPSASGVPDTPVERNAPDEPGTPQRTECLR